MHPRYVQSLCVALPVLRAFSSCPNEDPYPLNVTSSLDSRCSPEATILPLSLWTWSLWVAQGSLMVYHVSEFPFFGRLSSIPFCGIHFPMAILLIHLSVYAYSGHRDCVDFLAVGNNAATNICWYKSLLSHLSCFYPEMEWLDCMIIPCWNE